MPRRRCARRSGSRAGSTSTRPTRAPSTTLVAAPARAGLGVPGAVAAARAAARPSGMIDGPRPHGAEVHAAGRARHLPGHRVLGLLARRPRQPPAGRLRGALTRGAGRSDAAPATCSRTGRTGASSRRPSRGCWPTAPRRPSFYADGDYQPLPADGAQAGHVIAFTRRTRRRARRPVVAVPRLVAGLVGDGGWSARRSPGRRCRGRRRGAGATSSRATSVRDGADGLDAGLFARCPLPS